MQVWVRDILEAQQVLDQKTGHRYPKSEVHQSGFWLVNVLLCIESALGSGLATVHCMRLEQ